MSWQQNGRARKYSPGETVTTPKEIIELAERGEWLFFRGRPRHPSIVLNQQLGRIFTWLKAGTVRRAVRNINVPFVFRFDWYPDKPGPQYILSSSEVRLPESTYETRDAAERAVRLAMERYRRAQVQIEYVRTYSFIVPNLLELQP